MLLALIAYWGVGIPVGYWLTFNKIHSSASFFQNPLGFWIGLTIGLSVAAIFLSVRLKILYKRKIAQL
jgi:MATE family multidrug resistance protein